VTHLPLDRAQAQPNPLLLFEPLPNHIGVASMAAEAPGRQAEGGAEQENSREARGQRSGPSPGSGQDPRLAQGPDVPTTVPIPNPGQEQVEPAGGEVRIRQLPESVWQVEPIAGATGS